MKRENRVSLTVIANRCNTSTMTVSRALRKNSYVAEDTRRKILSVARELNYIPRGGSSAESNSATHNYFILFQQQFSDNDAFFSGVIRGIQQELFSHGALCSFGVIKREYEGILQLNDILKSVSPEGLIVVGDVPSDYLNHLLVQFPSLVLVDNPGGCGIKMPYNAIFYDNELGAELGLQHLIKQGRKDIILLCGTPEHYFTQSFIKGAQNTFGENGLELEPFRIFYSDFHITGGYEAAGRIMKSGNKFDAVFTNDEMAVGLIKAFKERGIRIPDDVAVVGYDNLPVGKTITPVLTTIAVDRERMGMLAARRAFELAQGTFTGARFEKTALFPELIIRESCGAKRRIVHK
jgi:DNA-binding LacI/PurR family transcriptional regulator